MEDLDFVVPLKPEYECPICLHWMQNPVQAEDCGHRFCERCIRKWMHGDPNFATSESWPCPTCQVSFTREKLFRDSGFERQILSLKVRCSFLGCSKVEELRWMLSKHVPGCEFRKVPCPEGCGAEATESEMKHHLEDVCPKRRMECSFCKKSVLLSCYMTHLPECPRKSMAATEESAPQCTSSSQEYCPAINGGESETPSSCPFESVGCQERNLPTPLAISRHLQEESLLHTQLTAAALSSLKQEISSLNLGDRTRGEILPPVLDFPCGETAKKSGANSEYGRNEKKDKTARDDTAGGDPAGATSGLSLPASTEAILRSAYSKAVENEHRHTELHIKVDQLMKKMEAVEQTLLTTQKMLEAANNRISQGEMTQGEIVWRLNDLNALLVHRGLVVYSKPFSSSPFGYRFCMRVNTVTPGGVDQHQYISLFLHLVPGEWDAILPWPFRGELTLAILEQGPVEAYNDSGKRHHVEERIRIPVSPGRKIPAAFSRPPCSVTRADKGYGFSQFVSVDLLRRSGRKYIQNNSLYLRAKVRPDFADPLSHLEDESGIKSAPLAKEVPRSEPLASGGNSPSPKTRLKGIAATFVHRTKSDSTRPDN